MKYVDKDEIIISLIFLGLMLAPLAVVYFRFPREEFRQRKAPGFEFSKIGAVAFGYTIFSLVWINISAALYFLTTHGSCHSGLPDWGMFHKISEAVCDGIFMVFMVVSGIDILLYPAGLGLSIAAGIIINRRPEFKIRNLGSLSLGMSIYLFFNILFDLLVMGASNMH